MLHTWTSRPNIYVYGPVHVSVHIVYNKANFMRIFFVIFRKSKTLSSCARLKERCSTILYIIFICDSFRLALLRHKNQIKKMCCVSSERTEKNWSYVGDGSSHCRRYRRRRCTIVCYVCPCRRYIIMPGAHFYINFILFSSVSSSHRRLILCGSLVLLRL